jgi:hypothetical protein
MARVDTHVMRQIITDTPQRASDFTTAFAESIVTDMKTSMSVSPSAPGDTPGVDTGTLRASIHQEEVGPYTRHIMDGVGYGIYLEFGTSDMAPRPWFVPAFHRAEDRFGQAALEYGLIVAK